MPQRVVITGLGAVSSIGTGTEAFWSALLEGRSGAVSLAGMPWMAEDLLTKIGAPVAGFDPLQHQIPERDLRLLDPVCQYALAAARMALEDAGLETEPSDRRKGVQRIVGVDSDRTATIMGTGVGGLPTAAHSHLHWTEKKIKTGGKRYWLPMQIANAVPAQVAVRFQAHGECKAVVTACASGTMGIGDGFRLVRDGEADMVFAGGAEATMSAPDGFALVGFDYLRTMSTRNDDPERACRPFDRDRDGFVLSEGAAVLMLESLDHALERGARVYAEVLGYATNCDAYHIVMLDPEIRQIKRLFRGLLQDTDTDPGEIDYINAHGTATVQNDIAETRAIRAVFGDHADRLCVSATKSMTGHAIGASGALEAVATALAIHRSIVPPTINLDNPDPECDLDYVPHLPVEREVRRAISTSYGFGGHNAALLLGRLEGD